MVKFLISFLISAFVLANCSSHVQKEEIQKSPGIEIPEAKKFVLGKWRYKRILPDTEGRPWQKKLNESIERSEPPILYLIFRDDNIAVFVNCTSGECHESELAYKVNKNGFIEIDAKGEEPLIVRKLGEDEINLEPRVKRVYEDPPLYYFYKRWTRLTE
jgi:hypothetical protein